MKFDLSKKKAVVTGGSSGIGKAIAETLKEQGQLGQGLTLQRWQVDLVVNLGKLTI